MGVVTDIVHAALDQSANGWGGVISGVGAMAAAAASAGRAARSGPFGFSSSHSSA